MTSTVATPLKKITTKYNFLYLSDRCRCDRCDRCARWRVVSIWWLWYLRSLNFFSSAIVVIIWKPGLRACKDGGIVNKVYFIILLSIDTPWINERLDRNLPDGIGSNIVEKYDVTLSRAIQPLTSDVLRVLFFRIFHYLCLRPYRLPMFWSKGWRWLAPGEDSSVRQYKTGRGKNQSKSLWNLWERRMTQVPDSYTRNGKPNYIKKLYENRSVHIYKSIA